MDTAQLDTVHGSEFLHAEAQLMEYRTIMGRLEELSLGASASRDFIHSLIAAL
ncbi:Scr1 family TA system antitoxin-like transcriptional regulator [Streptomyces sp. NPDC021622]|uniref:Scr1 family TA system antitoxin-like transcriptional regulator n=1 Tax=Streptomyces sp. NPDC021622 TaxID=3155013 RepID=UPI00340B1239